MIKRILVALDPVDDTPIATRYAIALAKNFDASLTGLAVIDTSNIFPATFFGEMDDTYQARDLWDELSEETREVASRLLEEFRKTVEEAGVRYTAIKKEGASYERIIEGMKYHDLLIAGRDSRFFYNEPERDTKTLAKVVKDGVCPTLVITADYHEIKRVLIAFDGSNAAARSLKSFVQLMPYGKDIEIELIYILAAKKDEQREFANSILSLAEQYLQEHELTNITKTVLEGDSPSKQILGRKKETGADLIVLGAHSVSAFRRVTFGSNTHELITKSNTPLFLSP